MYKSVDIPAQNKVNVVGSLISIADREGTTSAAKGSRPYHSCRNVVRVEQVYGGNTEVSEVPVDFIAMKHKKDGTNNMVYEGLRKFTIEFKSAAEVGMDDASRVSISGQNNGALSENMWASPNNPETVTSNFQIGASFMRVARSSSTLVPCATFDVEIFILNMEREINSYGEETGRLKIRGGLVRYGRKLDCFDFFVENKDAIDFIERNYSVNDTAHFVGRIRYTSTEIVSVSESWGESIPTTSSKKVHELIITGPGAGGESGPYEEEQSYDPDEIRVLVADRNARREQLKVTARASAEKKKVVAPAKPTYEWEE